MPSASISGNKNRKCSTGHMSEVGELNHYRDSYDSVQRDEDSSVIQEESSDDEVDQQSSKVQTEILKQLKKVNDRLDAVEDRMAVKHH